MKKYILVILSLFTIGQQGLTDPMTETITLNEKEVLDRIVKPINYNKNNFEEQINQINLKIKKDSSNFKLFYDRGLIYYKWANYLFNIPEFYKTEKEIKDNSDKYFKYFKLAGDDFEQSIKINPDYPDSYLNLAFSLIKVNMNLNNMFLKIDKSFDKNKYMEKLANKRSLSIFGRKELEKMGREYNNLLKNIKGLEQATEMTKKYALENIMEAEKISPENSQVYNTYTYYYINEANYAKAEENIKKAISLEPRNPELYNTYGLLNFNKKDYNSAENNFSTALELSPDNTEYIKNLSSVSIEKKDIDKTFSVLNKGLELEPDNEFLKITYISALNTFLKKNNHIEVINKFNKSVSDKANQKVFTEVLSSVYLISASQSTNNGQSIEFLKKTLLIEPDNNKAKTLLSSKYINKANKEKDIKNRIKILENALISLPENNLLRKEIAKNYKQTKNYDQAINHYKILSDKNNNNPDYYYQKALLYGLKKDKPQAINNLNKAISLDKKYKKLSRKESIFRNLK